MMLASVTVIHRRQVQIHPKSVLMLIQISIRKIIIFMKYILSYKIVVTPGSNYKEQLSRIVLIKANILSKI